MVELWKDIAGYENLYQVSNLGNVVSLKHKKPFILKPQKDDKGYLRVVLRIFNKTPKWCFVHRLVAKAFIENPNNYPIINHKDENPLNNNVENLEWCSYQYNINYGTAIERRAKKRSIPILQFDKNGILLNEYQGISDAARKTGINAGGICSVCKGKLKSAGGYAWKYKQP